jgi:putative addiction module component (TIGR02574 family)
MSEAATKLLPTLDALAESDRLGVVRHLLDGLEESPDKPEEVREAWKAELRRRLDELRSGKVKGIPIEEMFERSREMHP